jgi:hypothetical protein
VQAVLDGGKYPDGVKISNKQMRHLEERVLSRHAFHGEWNYTLRPAPAAPAEEPPPAPGPDLAALAALAGITDLPALLAAVAVPWQAAREQRLHLARGGPRRAPSGPDGPIRLPFDAVVAATACHHRLGATYQLLGQLLGTSQSAVSLAARRITPILAQHDITPRYQRARISTLGELREHATTHSIAITAQQPDNANHDDTPEMVN